MAGRGGGSEKQGHSAFPSLLPFRHLASTKGCYITAIYIRTPSLSFSLTHIGQHHTQTNWNCSSPPQLSSFCLLSSLNHFLHLQPFVLSYPKLASSFLLPAIFLSELLSYLFLHLLLFFLILCPLCHSGPPLTMEA